MKSQDIINKHFLPIVMAAFMLITSVSDAQAQKQQAQYDVYAGGLHVLDVNLTNDLSDAETYNIEMQSRTYGVLDKLASWQGRFLTKGWKGETFKPEQHQSVATFRGEQETKTYHYNKDGTFKDYSLVEDGKKKKSDADSALTQNTTDILTATMNLMRGLSAGQACNSRDEIFDGKRRYRLLFKEQARENLQKSRYNIYSGPAVSCTVEVEPLAGKWHEKPRGWASIQEQGRAKGSLPTVWFATIEDGKPAMPVKVRVKTDYGTLFMHLTGYKGLS